MGVMVGGVRMDACLCEGLVFVKVLLHTIRVLLERRPFFSELQS